MIFVDTSFFVAHAQSRDSRHDDAVALAGTRGALPLCTSTLILGETWTLLRKRLGHFQATAWLDHVRAAPGTDIHRIDEELEDQAWAWLRVHDERPYSFVDATSFALMSKLWITDALAFDGDFAAAGFNELRV